jgi:protein dithiol oxidoreductase (disulfide-forming)
MNPHRRTLLAAAALAPLLARADDNYTTLRNPLPVENPRKIEVAEFFWYGCIHCFHFEPLIEPWAAKLPPDAYFRRIPAVFSARWGHDAAIFYTFETLGVLAKVHQAFFDAIHRDGLRTDNPQALDQWLGRQGLDAKKFAETMKSFGVQTKLRRAAQLTAASQIDGTPALMVQGWYTISAEQGRGLEGMLRIADGLLPIVRKSLEARK